MYIYISRQYAKVIVASETNELCMYVDIECKIVEFICAGKVKRLRRKVRPRRGEGEIEGGKRRQLRHESSAHENKS